MKQINMICEACNELLAIVDVENGDKETIVIELECDCGFKKEIPISLKNLYFSTESK